MKLYSGVRNERLRGVLAVWSSLLALTLVVGCSDLFKDPPPPEPVGPQTREEVLNEIRPLIAPLRDSLTPGVPGISEAHRHQVMSGLHHAVVTYSDTDFGREALSELGFELMDIAKQAEQVQRFRLVLICIDATELLSVDGMLLRRLGERADVMLDKPVVRVRGFIDDHETKQTHVFLELLNHRTGAVERVEAREGEEFHNLRLVRIIGRNKSVLFEYLRVPGLFFEVDFR